MKGFAITFTIILISFSALNAASKHFNGYSFEATITGDCGIYHEKCNRAANTIYVHEGQEYSIVIRNPLPVRVAVAVTIDGLNVIDGKRTPPRLARKWIVEPYASLTLRGWQTGKESLRRFVFTNQSKSYAQWKERRDQKEYTQNLGLIGVAWFWNSEELRSALNPPITYMDHEFSESKRSAGCSPAPSAPQLQSLPRCKEESGKAGTGMGRKEHNSVTEVAFQYNTGMYAGDDVLVIRYEFGIKHHEPSPFLNDNDFAPDMYSRF